MFLVLVTLVGLRAIQHPAKQIADEPKTIAARAETEKPAPEGYSTTQSTSGSAAKGNTTETEEKKTLHAPSREAEKPELSASIVNPNEIALEYMNNSPQVVKEPASLIIIWDLDNLPADNNPLPIPSGPQAGMFLHPKTYSMPIPLAGHPEAKQLIKKGDRLFGVFTATCRDCSDNRGYWLFAVAGEGGWYSPWEKDRHPHPSDLYNKIRDIAARTDVYLDAAVPDKNKRIPIGPASF